MVYRILETLGLNAKRRKRKGESTQDVVAHACKDNRPSKTDDIRSVILDAAEELFAQDGYEVVTMRDLSAKSNVKLATIVYHFKSKENIYIRMVERVWAKIDAIRLDQLLEIEDNPSLEGYLYAYVSAPFMVFAQDDPSHYRARLMWRLSYESPDMIEKCLEIVLSEVTQTYLQKIRLYCPEFHEDKFKWFVYLSQNFINSTLGKSVGETYEIRTLREEHNFEDVIQRIVVSLIGVLRPNLNSIDLK